MREGRWLTEEQTDARARANCSFFCLSFSLQWQVCIDVVLENVLRSSKKWPTLLFTRLSVTGTTQNQRSKLL